jgi:hypothetical protein
MTPALMQGRGPLDAILERITDHPAKLYEDRRRLIRCADS